MEVGCGAGLLGITLLKTHSIRDYTFTDCHYRVLNFLIHNLQMNFPPVSAEGIALSSSTSSAASDSLQERIRQTTDGPPMLIKEDKVKGTSYHQKINDSGGEIVVQHLDWTEFNAEDFRKFDVILGSDIVYERSLIPGLCSVIRNFLTRSESSSPGVAYIACTERSHTTLKCFEEELDKAQLSHKVIHKLSYSPTETILSSDVQHQPTRLYRIELAPSSDSPQTSVGL